MKFRHLAALICVVLSTSGFTACSTSDITESEPTDTPNTPPNTDTPPADPPGSPVIEFPVQIEAPQLFNDATNGSVFTSNSGLTLYTFDNDIKGASNCNGDEDDEAGSTDDPQSCAGLWPPLLADSGAQVSGNFSLVERSDGTQQWAWKELPLYTFISDTAQGDILGDGLGDVWHIARPAPLTLTGDTEVPLYVGNQIIKTVSASGESLSEFRGNVTGFSLYIFDNDALNSSACYALDNGGCINTWPPLLADNGAKALPPLSLIALENGLTQWAFSGKPLYFYAGDNAAGQINGAGIGNVWHLAYQVPAIQRGEESNTVLTATGQVLALLPNDNNELVATVVDRDQFALYTFDNDSAGVSNCAGDCALAWPPFLASEYDVANGQFGIVLRDDGTLQWTWQERPLYFFVGDNEPGQINGDGINDVWHVITPDTEFNNETPDEPPVSTMVSVTSSPLGEVLVANSGEATDLQLYTFENDTTGSSACNGGCASAWPPLLLSDADAPVEPFSSIRRNDGSDQWTINGKPLYFFAGDSDASDQMGEGNTDTWYVARPAPTRVFTHETKGDMFVATNRVLPSRGQTSTQLNQLTLYTFDDDEPGSRVSTCFGGCADLWPPLYATSLDDAFGDFEVIRRDESNGQVTFQWAYKGLPLYFFIDDSELGDTGGDFPTWKIARP